MNRSDLKIDGAVIPWSTNFNWIREICEREMQSRKGNLSNRIGKRLTSCPEGFFGSSSAIDKIVQEAGEMLEYFIKGKYLEDEYEKLAYWRIAIEKDHTYQIFLGYSMSNFFPEIEDIARKILETYKSLEKGK